MAKKYVFKQIRKEELEEIEQILHEQIEVQAWYAIRFLELLDFEIVIPIN
ncbi:MAG: hypothetical protein HYY49_09460 [Ignavibacteriales bacterium]|nr:hypothetical protein [Ignavibacteriales bacterium]